MSMNQVRPPAYPQVATQWRCSADHLNVRRPGVQRQRFPAPQHQRLNETQRCEFFDKQLGLAFTATKPSAEIDVRDMQAFNRCGHREGATSEAQGKNACDKR